MSRAPVFAEDYTASDRAYAEATAELNRRVDEGTSWSGNERNTLFLNLGPSDQDPRIPVFADFSALAGFDFPDDSRAIATIDWDFDGDLDFVTTNRSAPRVRIFENRAVTRSASSVMFRLVGGEDNRDAIGARLELILRHEDGTESVMHRTVHCGQGFISQSSRWLHFGMPSGAQVKSVRAIWPRTGPEEFGAVAAGSFYVLRQGSGAAEAWGAPKFQIPAAVSKELPRGLISITCSLYSVDQPHCQLCPISIRMGTHVHWAGRVVVVR